MPLKMRIGAYAAGKSFLKGGRCVRAVKREENRKRRRRMSAETNAEKAVVCSVCRTYGGTLMNRHGGGDICRECRRKEKENEARNDG